MPSLSQRYKRFREEHLVFQYFTLVFTHWQAVLWGPSVLAVFWGMHFIVGTATPPEWVNWTAVVIALFVAGYYTWRADHVRLMPRLEVTDYVVQEVPTNQMGTRRVYVQIVPRCLTESPVQDVSGVLVRVFKRYVDTDDWELTDINEPLVLEWSYSGFAPREIYPGLGQRLNVCFRDNQIIQIQPTLAIAPRRWMEVFDSTGTFRFDIRITAKDCAPVDISIAVSLDGREWNNPKVEMLPVVSSQESLSSAKT